MIKYPILFGRRELIEGNGFIAAVALQGRLLLTDDDGDCWVEGVNPGGIAAHGDSPSESLAEFSSEYRVVLFDIAEQSNSFQEFKAEVERFFAETSPFAARDWTAAVEDVRSGKVEAAWLHKRPASSPLTIEVVSIGQPQARAAHNEEDEAAIAA